MANQTVERVWVLDTLGVVSIRPIRIQKIVLIPNAAGDGAILATWNENATPDLTKWQQTSTTTLTTTITSTANFPTATIDVGDIVKISETSSGNNVGTYQVLTNADNDTVTVTPAVTNEASKLYSWKTWTPLAQVRLLSQATNAKQEELDFGGQGFWLPNLCLTTLSASAILYVYVK